MFRSIFASFIFAIIYICQPLQAGICESGRIDVGPVYVHLDVLQSGRTIDTLHMKGIKADGTITVWKGIFVKPNFIWVGSDGTLTAGAIGVGHYIPIHKKFLLMPHVGIAFSYLRTSIDAEMLNLFHLTEKFHSSSPYVALDFSYYFNEKWTLLGSFQYAWSRTRTIIDPLEINDKSHTQGPNYSLAIDYRFYKNWSVSLGAGYNITLSKEKHGLRAAGVKVGLAYNF